MNTTKKFLVLKMRVGKDGIPALLATGMVTMSAPNSFFIRTFGVLLVRSDFRKVFKNLLKSLC